MKNKIQVLSLSLVLVLVACFFQDTSALAGARKLTSDFLADSGEVNLTEWHVGDENIYVKDNKLMIPAASSTDQTKFISKSVVKKSTAVDTLITASAAMRITQLPEGEQFILAFGLANIEAESGENGNVEIVFANNGGIVCSVIAYSDDEAITLVDKAKCGISVNSKFTLNAAIGSNGNFTVAVNGKNICNKELPVSGQGRFGILQTGSCGAEISELSVVVQSYETPENVNIEEDFEDGEFDASAMSSFVRGSNGCFPSYAKIEDYNGNKVFMFYNAGLGYIGTRYEYSNFEISFDVPYFQYTDIYDEDKRLEVKASGGVCLGFGEQNEAPEGEGYIQDTDFFLLGSTMAQSWLKKTWKVAVEDTNFVDKENNVGYSVKFTLVDGKGTLQLKGAKDKEYTTVATDYYEDYAKGYVRIWSSGNSTFAIDNLKITNLDKDGVLVDTDYKSSVITAEDYVLTDEDTKMVFREDENKAQEEKGLSSGEVLMIVSAATTVVLIASGTVISFIWKRKKGGRKNGEQ